MKFRLCGANNKNPFLARTFGGLRVMHFQKKTSSWEKLHRRNYIPLGGELISELEAVKRRCPCFKRVHSVSFELQHFCPGSDNTGCYGFVMVCFSRWVESDSFSWTCTKKRRNSLRGTLHSEFQLNPFSRGGEAPVIRGTACNLVEGPLRLSNYVPQNPFCPNLQNMYEEKICYPLISFPL